jgi:hypothetical protein
MLERQKSSLLSRSGRPYASFWHFFMKLFLAAPESRLPSWLTALAAHVSALHFFKKLALAAPNSCLPSRLTALLSQVSWAKAEGSATPNARMITKSVFMAILPEWPRKAHFQPG